MIRQILSRWKEGQVLWMTMILWNLFSLSVFGQIQIDSVRTIQSTCPNNGSISVYAKGMNPPLYYSITSGPQIQPVQTGNVFNSLLPGSYKIKVSDGSGNSMTATATVTGSCCPRNTDLP